ncbi:MAG: hypothetical protein K1X89_23790 [Myxococcaceae bacterium]|nr:hypothetical protein [Myxococcaceae bacterium]
MKVRDSKDVAALPPPAASAPPRRPKEDTVRVDRASALAPSVESTRVATGSARAQHLEALRSAVRGGTVRPSADQIAEKILQTAELDARLRAMFEE